VILAIVTAIISFFLVLLIQSSSFFVIAAVDMPQLSPSPPATTTTEKPDIPPSSTTTTTMPPKMPKVEEKKDPKDGDTILSSKIDDGTTTVATKVSKDSNIITFDFNRGYVMGVAMALNPQLSEDFNKKIRLLPAYFPVFNEEYQNGILSGLRDGGRYLDTFGLLDKSGSPAKK
jgi:hypothetical protein